MEWKTRYTTENGRKETRGKPTLGTAFDNRNLSLRHFFCTSSFRNKSRMHETVRLKSITNIC